MTQTLLIIGGILVALAGAFGFLSLLPPIPAEILAFIAGPVKLMKLLDPVLPVHEFLTWLAFAVGIEIGLFAVAFAYRLGSMASGSGVK